LAISLSDTTSSKYHHGDASPAVGSPDGSIPLLQVSGVPLLEAAADRKWGHDPAYVRYKLTTPVLLLRPPPKRHAD
jgi:hypothetical protein